MHYKRPINVAIVAMQNGWLVGPPFRYDVVNDHKTEFCIEWAESATFCKTADAVADCVKRLLVERE